MGTPSEVHMALQHPACRFHYIVNIQYDPGLGEGGGSKDLTLFRGGGEGRGVQGRGGGGRRKQCVIVNCS